MIGAPYSVTKEIMESLNIDLVIHGSTEVAPEADGSDPYQVSFHCRILELEQFLIKKFVHLKIGAKSLRKIQDD